MPSCCCGCGCSSSATYRNAIMPLEKLTAGWEVPTVADLKDLLEKVRAQRREGCCLPGWMLCCCVHSARMK